MTAAAAAEGDGAGTSGGSITQPDGTSAVETSAPVAAETKPATGAARKRRMRSPPASPSAGARRAAADKACGRSDRGRSSAAPAEPEQKDPQVQRAPTAQRVASARAHRGKCGRRALAPAAKPLGSADPKGWQATDAPARAVPAVCLCELPSMLEGARTALSPNLASVGLEHAPLTFLTLHRAPRGHQLSLAWSHLVASALPPAADEDDDEDEAAAPGAGQRAIDQIELCRPGKLASLATALAGVGQRIPGHALAYPIAAMLLSDVSAHPPAAAAAHAALRASLANLAALSPMAPELPVPRRGAVDASSAYALVPPVAEAVLQRMIPATAVEDEAASNSRALRALPMLDYITASVRAAVATPEPHGDASELVRAFAGASSTAEAASRCLAHSDARIGAAAAGLLEAIEACNALSEPAHSARSMVPAAIACVFDALPSVAFRDRLLRSMHGRAFGIRSLALLLEGRTTKKPLVDRATDARPTPHSLHEVLTAHPKKQADAVPLLLIQAAFVEAAVERGSLSGSSADLRRALAAACGDLSQKCASCGLIGTAASLDLAGELFSTL